jgi:hypothetical protein
MKSIQNAAFVVSVHCDKAGGPTRLHVKWNGKHEISDFDLDHLGNVVNYETETEHSGWVLVSSSGFVNDLSVAQFGPKILQSQNLVEPGAEIPLRSRAVP